MVQSQVRSGFPAQGSFVFEFCSEAEARGVFACDAASVVTILEKWQAHQAIVRIPGQADTVVPIDTLRLMVEFEPVVNLFFADTSLPPSVLKAAIQKSEDEGRWGIVRMSDQRQVIMSSGMTGVLLSGVGIDETTNWRRPEFWHPEDLSQFNQDWQQQLDESGSNAISYRYRIHKPGTDDPYEYYRSSYRLLRADQGGGLFQVCTFIDRG